MHTRLGGWIGVGLAAPLLVAVGAACASSKGGRAGEAPAGGAPTSAAARDTAALVGAVYGGGRAPRRVSRITSADVDRAGNMDLVTFLESRLAGVRIQNLRGEYVVRITGATSENSRGALVLIDGTEGSLASLRTYDIATAEVLRDAAAGVYGVRGGAGVLAITTRRR